MSLKRLSNKTVIAFLLIILLMIIGVIGYVDFVQHRNTIVKQQQENLLTIAKSISRTLDSYINHKIKGLAVLAKNPLIYEKSSKQEDIIRDFYKAFGEEMQTIALVDEKGNLIYQYPKNDVIKVDIKDINYVIKNNQAKVTKEYKSDDNQFSFNILQPVINNTFKGVLVGRVNINELYNTLIQPIKPGKMGYVMVKNMNGVIIMHPVEKQIGVVSLKYRKENFPEYDWKELEELYRKQIEEKEGYHIYHSIWWQENDMKWSKKINSYTKVKISDISWIIAVQMDYVEIEKPIRDTLINISLIAITIIILLLFVSYIIIKVEKRRKALEIETKYLKKLNETWQELIKSEERLRHSQKLQTIGTLTSGISHEFNNLLTPILGYSEMLLQNSEIKKDIREDVEEIKKSALRAKEIIDQILGFSRNDNKASVATPVRVDKIIKESTKLIKSIKPNNIKVIEKMNTSEIILGSTTQLQQVLLNLCTNSYHAMGEKGGILEIEVDEENIDNNRSKNLKVSEGKYIKIQVKDTGKGMDKETLSRIFDPFFTTKEEGKGTGLGLSVVYGIIKKHKGTIVAQSEINVGTTVVIYLPIFKEV